MCTYCNALLWPAEAVKVKRAQDREGGTGWRGKTCCSKGTAVMEPVERSAAIDAIFDHYDQSLRKTLVKHSRKCAAVARRTKEHNARVLQRHRSDRVRP